MSYLTMEVEIDHGRILPREPAKLPDKGKGLLTVLEPSDAAADAHQMSQLEAFHALKESLNLDEARKEAWMDIIRDARR